MNILKIDIFKLFILDKLFLKFKYEEFTFRDATMFLSRTYRIDKSAGSGMISQLIHENYIIKKELCSFKNNIESEINKSWAKAYLDRNKILLLF